ncbi:MAG: hypothetical protein IPL46_01650 [Saprospiraceae bacterium]|nr:hypothetical protein [Saprospiraceae bacterium]
MTTSKNNLILENTIGFNGKAGNYIYGGNAIYNRISANRIALNKDQGISCTNGGNDELTPPSISKFENSILSGIATEGQIIEIFFDTLDQGLIFYGSYPIHENGFFEVWIENPVLTQ